MSPVLLLLAIILFLFWYCWRNVAPYLQFSNVIWFDWDIISKVILGNRPKDMPIGACVFEKLHKIWKAHENEEFIVVWLSEPILIVYGEEAVKFLSNESTLTDKPHIYDLFKFMGDTAIFVKSGKRFREVKKIMMPAFYPSVIKSMVPIMNHHASFLVQRLNDLNGEETDRIEEFLKNNTLRTFLQASMGIQADSEENKLMIQRLVCIFVRLLDLAAQRIGSPWLHHDFMLKFSSIGREYIKLRSEVDEIATGILEDMKESVTSRIQAAKSSDEDPQDCLSRAKSLGEILIEQHLKDPSFDMEEVKNQVTGILTGGFDTTANTLMWIFWLLGHHPDVQQKAYEEVMALPEGDLTYEDSRNLPYIECIIKETLRLYPVAPVYARKSRKELKFGKYIIPNGTFIVFCLYALHRDAKIYPDPDAFNPDRFAEGESTAKPWAHIPFAEGVRSCIGKSFAMVEIKVILTRILRNFKIISLDRPEDVTLAFEIMLKTAKHFRMRFIPR